MLNVYVSFSNEFYKTNTNFYLITSFHANITFSGEEGETSGDWPQEGGGEEADGGGLQSQEGQERFHDPREKEEA